MCFKNKSASRTTKRKTKVCITNWHQCFLRWRFVTTTTWWVDLCRAEKKAVNSDRKPGKNEYLQSVFAVRSACRETAWTSWVHALGHTQIRNMLRSLHCPSCRCLEQYFVWNQLTMGGGRQFLHTFGGHRWSRTVIAYYKLDV